MSTGSKVMTHYVVEYIYGDLDLDLGEIFSKVRQFLDIIWRIELPKYRSDLMRIVDTMGLFNFVNDAKKKTLCFIMGCSLPWENMLSSSDRNKI